MGFHYSPRITTNGLVLCLDAGNSKSYPGTGSIWYDTSKNGSNGVLINNPTFNTSNGGGVEFNGSNYCNFFAPNLNTTTTVEMWCKIGNSYNNRMFFGWSSYDVYCGSNHLGYNTSNGDVYGISSTRVSSLGLVNKWVHYVFEMKSDVSYTNNKIYINGVSENLSQQQSTENPSQRNFNNGYGRIAGWLNSVGYLMPMVCSTFRVYNRALNQEEILQNYNTMRSKFNS